MPGKSIHMELEGHPVPAGIAFSRDGGTAYVAFSRNNSLAVIDTETRKVKKEIAVGIAPFAVALSRQGTVCVSNPGGRRPPPGDTAEAGPDAVPESHAEGGAGRNESAVEDAAREAVARRAAIGGDELVGAG